MLDRTKTSHISKSASAAALHLDSDGAAIAVIGLGYVGLPLAVQFGKRRPIVGFDIREERINELKSGHDSSLALGNAALACTKNIHFTADSKDLKRCKIFIVTVPTPID